MPTICICTLTCMYNKDIHKCECGYTLHICKKMYINVSSLILWGKIRIVNMKLDHSDLFKRCK